MLILGSFDSVRLVTVRVKLLKKRREEEKMKTSTEEVIPNDVVGGIL